MAVVFISPKKRQKMFFLMITGVVLLFLIIVALSVLLAEPEEIEQKINLKQANIDVNTKILKQKKFTDLKPFPAMEKQFKYTAKAQNEKIKEDFISASNIGEAQKILEEAGWELINIEEVGVGRNNPFESY
jgi:hypothetical protein